MNLSDLDTYDQETSSLPLPEETPSAPETSTDNSGGAQSGLASIFADPQDLRRYKLARMNGASEQEALRVGDNGVGFKGDVTATYKVPQVALPPDTPGFQYGRMVKVDGPNGSVIAKLTDKMPYTDNLRGKATIDLNPATAMAVGHQGGVMPVKWSFVDSGSPSVTLQPLPPLPSAGGSLMSPTQTGIPDLPPILNPVGEEQTPQDLATGLIGQSPQDPLSMGTTEETADETSGQPATQDTGTTPPIRGLSQGAKLVGRTKDGGYQFNDGTILYKDASGITQVRDYDGVKYIKRPYEKWQKISGQSEGGTNHIEKDAAGHVFSINPKTGESRDITPAGFQGAPKIFRDTTSGLAFDITNPQNPKPLNLPGNPASVDLTNIKPGDWSSVPEDVRDVAKNISEYNYPPLSGMALRSPYFQQMFKVISKVDPSFDYKNYQARQQFLTDFSGKGKIGQNILSFDTALDHMGRALDKSEVMGAEEKKRDITSPVMVKGLWATKGSLEGDPRANNYEADAHTLVNEYARAVSGAAPTEGERASWDEKLIGGTLTYRNAEQRRQAMSEMAHNLGSRLGEIEKQYERTMGKPLDVSLLSPEAESTLQKLGATDLIEKYGSKGGQRTYMDPKTEMHVVQPFPGSEKDVGTENHREIVEDGEGKKFIVNPDGKLIPYE